MLTGGSGRARASSFAMQKHTPATSRTRSDGRASGASDTGFADLVPEQPIRRQIAGSVQSFSRATNTLSGEFLPTNLDTNIAVNGDGFFSVGQRPMQTTSIVRPSPELYTRRGDFELDRQGFMVNGAG